MRARHIQIALAAGLHLLLTLVEPAAAQEASLNEGIEEAADCLSALNDKSDIDDSLRSWANRGAVRGNISAFSFGEAPSFSCPFPYAQSLIYFRQRDQEHVEIVILKGEGFKYVTRRYQIRQSDMVRDQAFVFPEINHKCNKGGLRDFFDFKGSEPMRVRAEAWKVDFSKDEEKKTLWKFDTEYRYASEPASRLNQHLKVVPAESIQPLEPLNSIELARDLLLNLYHQLIDLESRFEYANMSHIKKALPICERAIDLLRRTSLGDGKVAANAERAAYAAARASSIFIEPRPGLPTISDVSRDMADKSKQRSGIK